MGVFLFSRDIRNGAALLLQVKKEKFVQNES